MSLNQKKKKKRIHMSAPVWSKNVGINSMHIERIKLLDSSCLKRIKVVFREKKKRRRIK